MHQVQQLAALYKEAGLRHQTIKSLDQIFELSIKIKNMEEQLIQHLSRLQTPDLRAALNIDSDDAIVLHYDVYRASHRIMEWFNTYLSQSQRAALSAYMNIGKGGMAHE